jgi:DHA2 family multidrug resistance protein
VSLAAFVVRELTAPAPAVDLRLFADRSFLSASTVGGVQFAMMMANMFLLPVFMQELLGYTATQSGTTLLPRALVMLVMNPVVGRLYNRIAPKAFVIWGIAWVSAGSFWMSRFNLSTGPHDILVGIIIQGVGFSCLFAPLTAAALTNVPRHRLADATGLSSLMRQLGGSVGLAVFATLLTRFGTQARASLAAHVTDLRPEAVDRLDQMTRAMAARGLDPVTAKGAALGALQGLVFRHGMVLAFRKDFFLLGIVFLTVVPLAFFLQTPNRGRPAPAAH